MGRGSQIERLGLVGRGRALVHWGGRQTCLGEGQSVEADGVENQSWMCGRYQTPAQAGRCWVCGPPGQGGPGWGAGMPGGRQGVGVVGGRNQTLGVELYLLWEVWQLPLEVDHN